MWIESENNPSVLIDQIENRINGMVVNTLRIKDQELEECPACKAPKRNEKDKTDKEKPATIPRVENVSRYTMEQQDIVEKIESLLKC